MKNRKLFFSVFVILMTFSMLVTGCQPEPVQFVGNSESYQVDFDLDGASMGYRHAKITITSQVDEKSIETVKVNTDMPGMPMNMPVIEAEKINDNVYEIKEKELFNMTGDWYIVVEIANGASTESVQFDLEVSP